MELGERKKGKVNDKATVRCEVRGFNNVYWKM
jgi:hypothetical protein